MSEQDTPEAPQETPASELIGELLAETRAGNRRWISVGQTMLYCDVGQPTPRYRVAMRIEERRGRIVRDPRPPSEIVLSAHRVLEVVRTEEGEDIVVEQKPLIRISTPQLGRSAARALDTLWHLAAETITAPADAVSDLLVALRGAV